LPPNALAYYAAALITAVKSFVAWAPGQILKTIMLVDNFNLGKMRFNDYNEAQFRERGWGDEKRSVNEKKESWGQTKRY
jgi:hypothetical protein